jgi:hypothetical protein
MGKPIIEQFTPTARRQICGLNEGSERLGTIALRSKPPLLLALDWGYPLTEIAAIRYKQSEDDIYRFPTQVSD